MIEGLKFDVKAEEMAAHLLVKIEHHREREAFYAGNVGALEAGSAEAMQYSGGDPVRALKDKESEHRRKAELFQFLHDHLIPGEVYRLEDRDLTYLEFISGGRW